MFRAQVRFLTRHWRRWWGHQDRIRNTPMIPRGMSLIENKLKEPLYVPICKNVFSRVAKYQTIIFEDLDFHGNTAMEIYKQEQALFNDLRL